jgi:Plasmid pRiA4b ORF-3-like protein
MAARNETAGKCQVCDATFSKRQMVRHLAKCAYPGVRAVAVVAQLRVDVPGSPFWLDLDIKSHAVLRELDEFLRGVWLECCDHLSSFNVGRTRYVATMGDAFVRPELGECSMNTRVSAALPPAGSEFAYEYDFGSTTRLRLKVVSERLAPTRHEAIRVLARNDAPVWNCEDCAEAATFLCASCFYRRDAFLCEAHVEEHQCGEEAMLPVVNSPRMGVCGYTGGG